MKKILIFTLFLALANISFGQNRTQQGQRPTAAQMIEKATEELDLTDEQVQQWEAIHEKYDDSLKDRSSREENMKKMGEELEATLTDEQKEKFATMKKSKRQPRRDY